MMQERLPTLFGTSGGPRGESEAITHYDIKRFIKRNSSTLLGSALVGIFAAVTYIMTAVPLYTAYTQIIIDPSLPQALREPSESIFSIDNAQVESQLEVLRSEEIAKAVISQLKLEDIVEFSGSNGTIFGRLWRPSATETAASAFARKRATLARFDNNLSVRRVGLSYAIEILFSSRDPELAAKVANATADAYVTDQISARAQAVRQSGQWLEARIDQLRKQMNAAALDAQEFRAKRDYRILGSRTAPADGERSTSRDAAEHKETMEELNSTAQTYRRIYESYLMAYTESVQKQSYPVTNARIITAATPPLATSYPRTKLVLAFGALMGCLAGIAIAFFRHQLDRSIWTPRQVRDQIGVDCVASIPRLATPDARTMTRAALDRVEALPIISHALAAAGPWIENNLAKFLPPPTAKPKRILPAVERRRGLDKDSLAAVVRFPLSGFSLGVRRLKTAISLAAKTRPIRCIGIASALPGEGKTTVAANLATLFAQSGLRTLLVDGDVRNASLSRLLSPRAKVGLLEAIAGTAKLQQCIVKANDVGLELLPVAHGPPLVNSEDILGSERARRLIDELQKSYDIVVFEMPPLTASLDGLGLSSMLDATMVLVEWGKTPMAMLSETIRLLRNAGAEVTGVVLTKVDTSTVQYGDLAVDYLSYGYGVAPVHSAAEAGHPRAVRSRH